MNICAIDNIAKERVERFAEEHWGSPIMVTKGRAHRLPELPGFAVLDGDNLCGLITYHMDNRECEIVSLNSLRRNQEVGSHLIEHVVSQAKSGGCRRVWLVTTNDNTQALRFYQRRGFIMIALHFNAVTEARKIKQNIPLYGYDDIPILHEIELEKRL